MRHALEGYNMAAIVPASTFFYKNSCNFRPVRCSSCSLREGTPPAASSRVTRSTRHIGKNISEGPINGSSWATACTQSSKALRSRPRKNTPAELMRSSTPQHFSRGLCRTTTTASPSPIPRLLVSPFSTRRINSFPSQTAQVCAGNNPRANSPTRPTISGASLSLSISATIAEPTTAASA